MKISMSVDVFLFIIHFGNQAYMRGVSKNTLNAVTRIFQQKFVAVVSSKIHVVKIHLEILARDENESKCDERLDTSMKSHAGLNLFNLTWMTLQKFYSFIKMYSAVCNFFEN